MLDIPQVQAAAQNTAQSPVSMLPSVVPMIVMASVVIVSIIAWVSKRAMSMLILHPASVRERKEVYRLLTAGWLHSDISHLAFNLFTFYFFADKCVRVLGEIQFLILYVSAVIVGFIPTTLRHMKNPRYSSLGASGAVAAVIFSAILLYPNLKLGFAFLPIAVPGLFYGLGYLAYSAYQSWRAKGGINHDAHFSGAIYGAALTFVFEPTRVMQTISSFQISF